MRNLFTLCCIFIFFQAQAQTNLSGIINHYSVVMEYDSCIGKLSVSDTTGFLPGNKILVYHAQGAIFSTTNNTTYGAISTMQTAGRYEYALIESRAAGAVFLKYKLRYPVSPDAHIQLITVPVYTNATITDTLKAKPWNGQTGGLIAFEVTGTLTMNAPIEASGTGFRGGVSYIAAVNNCTWVLGEQAFVYALGNWRGGNKGEGIGGVLPNQELGRGPVANGGGGGNDHNSGGGGGGNLSAGGRGGDNNDPSLFTCDGNFPGIGGLGITDFNGRLFLGGGGGSGHCNNVFSSDGGYGGGIILLTVNSINGTQPLLMANGLAGKTAGGDGAGAGGAGGTVWLQVTNAPANLQIQANGGRGGNSNNIDAARCFGPGGGGAGGRILTNITGVLPPAGGAFGIVTASTSGCNGSNNGAVAGSAGQVQAVSAILMGNQTVGAPMIATQPVSAIACAGEVLALYADVAGAVTQYQWQSNTGTGWMDIPNGNTPVLSITATQGTTGTAYRLIASAGICGEAISDSAILTVLPDPTAQFTYQPISATTFQFDGSSQNALGGVRWDFGDGNTADVQDPVHTYASEGSFTVTFTAWNSCDTIVVTEVLNIIQAPVAAFDPPSDIIGCGSAAVQFDNQSTGANTVFTWLFEGGMPAISTQAEPTILYTQSGTYTTTLTASNAAGMSTVTHVFSVEIIDFPQANFMVEDLPGSVVQFTNQSTGAGTITWDFGDGTPLSSIADPVHYYPATGGDFVVKLTISNPCGASIYEQTITVDPTGVGTAETPDWGSVQVFPNPTSGLVQVDCRAVGQLPQRITVSGMDGKSYLSLQVPGQQTVIDLNLRDLPASLYVLRIEFENGVVVRRVVKK